MKKLLDEKTTPPGGWRFIDPETGYNFHRSYSTLDQLVDHINSYRAENRLDPLPDTRAIVMHYICSKPRSAGRCVPVRYGRSLSQYLAGLNAAIKMAVRPQNKGYVPAGVSEKRAETCVRCPYNKLNQNHSSLGHYSDRAVQALVGARTTSQDGKLFSCSICTCPLRSKVHVAQDIVEASLSAPERVRLPQGLPGLDNQPLYCWQIKPVEES